MSSLWDQLVTDDGEPRLRSGGGMTVAEVIRRLEAGDSPGALGISTADLMAVLGFAALEGPESPGPALVQQPPRRPRLKGVLSEPSLARLLPGATHPARLALAAGLLQVHDFWDASHEAAQAADDRGERPFSAYWHGIAHRREPDASNAAYWFRRVGRHSIFPALSEAARPILEAHGDESLGARILGRGGWNPMAMIDLCTEARPGTPQEAVARRLQRLEMQMLLDATAAAVIPGL
jgi:hypothetical protein